MNELAIYYLKLITFSTNLIFALVFYFILPKFKKEQQLIIQIIFCACLAVLCTFDLFFLNPTILWLVLAIYWTIRSLYHLNSYLKFNLDDQKQKIVYLYSFTPEGLLIKKLELECVTVEIVQELFELNESDLQNFKSGSPLNIQQKEKQLLQDFYTKKHIGIIYINLADYNYYLQTANREKLYE